MLKYKNIGGNSNVISYEIADDSILADGSPHILGFGVV